MPGAYKVLVFFLLQHIYNIEALGSIAFWQSTAQIIGYFTAIGWASLVLVRVAKAKTKKDGVEAFNRLCHMSLYTLITCCFCIISIGELFDRSNDAIQIALWTIGWTCYQMPRHYLIALRAYRKAILLDLSVITLSTISIITAPLEAASLCLALSMILTGLMTLVLIQQNTNAKIIHWEYELKGLEFGLVNFLGGGVSLSLIPLAAILESESFVGVLSLFISTMGIALLIPRAISVNQLPTLSKIVDAPEVLAAHIKRMRRQISLSNVGTSITCLAIGAIIIFRSIETIQPTSMAIIFLLITLQNTLSTQGLIDSNILICKEKSRSLLKINTATSTTFLIVIPIIIWKPMDHAFIYICLTTALLNLYRLNRTRHYAKLSYDSHTAL